MTKIIKRAATAMKKAAQQFTAWSFSRWKDYEKCPAYGKYKHIDKLKEPESPAGEAGQALHQGGQDYLMGKLKLPPASFRGFRKDLKKLKKLHALAEHEWAFDFDWEKVGWFDPRAWCRIKVDAHYVEQEKAIIHSGSRGKTKVMFTTVHIIDYKSGKVHDEHYQQRTLYALGAMLVYPDAQRFVVEHWYVEHDEIRQDTFEAADFDELKREWESNIVPMFRDKRFAPRPGNHCRWCFFSKAKGGPCRF